MILIPEAYLPTTSEAIRKLRKDCRFQSVNGNSGKEGGKLTQTWREQCNIQVGDKLLLLSIKHALSSDDIARHADADDLEHRLEDEEYEMTEIRVRLVAQQNRLLEAVEGAGREGPANDGGDAIIAICESE